MNILSPERRKEAVAKSIATRKRNIEIRNAERRKAYEYTNLLRGEIEELESKLKSLRREEEYQTISFSITSRRLMREEDIVAASQPWDRVCGVYFLIKGNRVVYVGQSMNVHSRIPSHTITKDFDSVTVISCDKDQLDVLESLYIYMLDPPLNSNNERTFAPMTLEALTRMKNEKRICTPPQAC